MSHSSFRTSSRDGTTIRIEKVIKLFKRLPDGTKMYDPDVLRTTKIHEIKMGQPNNNNHINQEAGASVDIIPLNYDVSLEVCFQTE